MLKLYELFKDNKRIYLVMDNLVGGELYDLLNEKDKLDEEVTAHII